MADPDLHEGAWDRAKRDAEAVYRSSLFGVVLTIAGLLAAGVAVLVADSDADTVTRVVVPTVSGLAAIVIVVITVLAFQLAVAPYRQRNELRRGWKHVPVPKPPDVELTIRNFARQARDISGRTIEKASRADEDEFDELSAEVFAFFGQHGLREAGRMFSQACEVPGWISRRARERADCLQKIADELQARESAAAS